MIGIKRREGITEEVGEEVAVLARLRSAEPTVKFPGMCLRAGDFFRIGSWEASASGER